MSKSAYLNHLRAAKRRIIAFNKLSGVNTKSSKHFELVKFFCEQKGIAVPGKTNYRKFIVDLYLNGDLGDIKFEPKKLKQKNKQRVSGICRLSELKKMEGTLERLHLNTMAKFVIYVMGLIRSNYITEHTKICLMKHWQTLHHYAANATRNTTIDYDRPLINFLGS